MTEETIKQILKFRDDRDWKQFHNPKDLAISISLEAAELLEVFQWSGADVSNEGKQENESIRCMESENIMISICVHESAFANFEDVKDFLDIITLFEVTGFYVIIERKIVQSILMRHGKYIENYHQLQT